MIEKKNKKWWALLGLALATPGLVALPGCNGGSNSGGLPGIQQSPYAGLSAAGPVTDSNGATLGTLNFTVANNGDITGTLDGPTLETPPVAKRSIAKRGVVSGTGQVGNDGLFHITFETVTGGTTVTYTFKGKLAQVNGGVVASDLTYTGTNDTSGSFSVTITLPTPGTGGNGGPTGGSGSFTLSNSGSNANVATLNPSSAVVTAIRVNDKITSLTATFIDASNTSNVRTLTVSIGNLVSEVAPGTFQIGDGAAVGYTETNTGTRSTRAWNSDATGSVQLVSLSATQAVIRLNGVTLAAPPPGTLPNDATGSFTLSGEGTGQITATP
jgi:hypothetical protein